MESTNGMTRPTVIQGGMGIGVSNWSLARAVSRRGQLGVVSGTCIDTLFVRRLQDGDPGGHLRRAIAHFPIAGTGEAALAEYYLTGGRDTGAPYKVLPMWGQNVGPLRERLTMLASFVEVFLAKERHDGKVGINLLTKVQLPNLATLYGAMLAGVDCVIMGAGIPREIPGVLDAFSEGRVACMKFDVAGPRREEGDELTFDPRRHFGSAPRELRRPDFLPVVSSHTLAGVLARKANGRIDGFVVEGPTAGGHNAPPRGRTATTDAGEPVYGERDEADLEAMRRLELPFWLAGGWATPERLAAALESGAAGIQVGTLFAYAAESGLDPRLRQQVLAKVRNGEARVRTDGVASPTGFPFKVVELEGTYSDADLYLARERNCDLGYLRTAYRRDDGRIGYRCPAEPVGTYVKKGGAEADTAGRKCLCNALLADVGHAQVRTAGNERALVTSGDGLHEIRHFLGGRDAYTAADVLAWLLPADEHLASAPGSSAKPATDPLSP